MQENINIIPANQKGDFILDDPKQNQESNQSNETVKDIISRHGQVDRCLDLANQSLKIIPQDIFIFKQLQQLYLENNNIVELQVSFFNNLPMLIWLDLRYNKLKQLPSNIGHHRCLKHLLLEGNELTELPVELGQVESLIGLNLHGNPINFPPKQVIEEGIKSVKSFLLEEYKKNNDNSEDDDEKEISPESSSVGVGHIINKIGDYVRRPPLRRQRAFDDFHFSKPIPLYPASLKSRRNSETTDQLMALFKKRMELLEQEKKKYPRRRRRRTSILSPDDDDKCYFDEQDEKLV